MNMVIFGTCIGVMVLYQVIATFGYFTFHQLLIEVAAGGDILNMFVVLSAEGTASTRFCECVCLFKS